MFSIKYTSRDFALAFLGTWLLSGLCFASPVLSLSTKAGTPTSYLQVSGSGFPASAAIDIYFDATVVAKTSANGAGAFSKIKIQVPPSAPPGTNQVKVVAVLSGETAQTAF